ncbi:uncharacterized protein LOC116197739 isoform X3 [Punica granatum]|uniref:Uncharacterized protein LOC116197739 isoform X3 n=1 Tax=Punica granatum TaxID=22663 RepID=A0A6P8CRB2_PUNGR|nr:uncharacterized protein LOC116197739 isoform X3 [Punica granatum]
MKKRISLGAEKTNHSDVRPEELSFEEREDESALLSVEARRERGTMPEVAPDMEEASTDSSYNGNGNGNGKGKGKGKGNSTDGPGNDSSGGNKVGNLFETFMSTQQFQNSLKSLFQRKRPSIGDESDSPRPLPFLSQLANSVVSRCARNLKTSTEELQQRFDSELPESVRTPLAYARNFLEFCSLETLHVLTRNPNYLGDKEFRQLTFDMMLAWEAPGSEVESLEKEASSSQEAVDGDGGSLFYSSSTNMAVQVDDKKTVGRDAFAQIAPACAAIADAITVYNLFDVLTGSSSQRLHFIMYDKYLRNLDRVIKAAKSALGPPLPNLQLADGEIILDVDGTVPTHPVLQHIGITAWPGRLTLTTKALYFESLGVGVYDKAVRYDLATDMKQVIKPELTGPLGARIFDKAVMYKSVSVTEPVYMEFPEFKGNSRRDYCPYTKQMKKLPPVALITLRRLGFTLLKQVDLGDEAVAVDVCVGDTNPFDKAVKKSILDTGRVEAAQASIDQVKVEGIDTNMAVMKELLFPVLQLAHHLQVSASWEHPFKSTVFLALVCLMIYRGWIRYVVPSIFVFFAVTMLWRRHFYKGKSVEAYKIIAPPNRNPVEQLLTLQDAIGQVESLIQAGNIILLKIRALLFAVLPQATERVALLLVLGAAVFAFVPLRCILVFAFLEAFTREMPLRRESSERTLRRLREWWFRIPAAPVQLVRAEDKKNK